MNTGSELDPAEPESKPEPNRILIVDDEDPSRDLCRQFLETDGHDHD